MSGNAAQLSKSIPVLLGRDREWSALDRAVWTDRTEGALVLVRAEPGMGKTTLLEAAGSAWTDDGRCVVAARLDGLSAGLPATLLAAVRARWDDTRDSGALHRADAAVRSLDTGEMSVTGDHPPVMHLLARAVAALARARPTVLVLDDVDTVDRRYRTDLAVLCRGATAGGVPVVAALCDSEGLDLLVTAASQVIDLAPFADADVEVLVNGRTAAGRPPVDRSVLGAVGSALGTLAGNPRTVLGTVALLEDAFTVRDGCRCLPDGHPVALPLDHPLPRAILTRDASTVRLAETLAVLAPVAVDDLPAVAVAAGLDTDHSGTAHDRLVRMGALRVDDEEITRWTVPALGTALGNRLPRRRRERTHAAFATAQLARTAHHVRVDLPAVARHVLGAGPRMPTGDGTEVLLAEANRLAGTAPHAASACLRAALRCCPREDPRWTAVVRGLLHHHLRLGALGVLADEITAVIAPGLLADPARADPALCLDVAVLWLAGGVPGIAHPTRQGHRDDLPALARRCGHPVLLRTVADAIAGHALTAAAAALRPVAERVRAAGGSPDCVEQVGAILDLLGGATGDNAGFAEGTRRWRAAHPDVPARLDATLIRGAGGTLNHAVVLEHALAGNAAAVADRPRAYRDVVAGYERGEWDAALSAARLLDGGTPGANAPARAFAADICATRGQLIRAQRWLTGLRPAAAGGFLVTWAQCGVLWRLGRGADALRSGWHDYLCWHRDGTWSGVYRLLLRLAAYAARLGLTGELDRARGELRRVHETARSPGSAAATRFVDGMCRDDPEGMRAGLTLFRANGSVTETVWACVECARVAEQPEALLHEAHALVRNLGADVLVADLGVLMRERGVPAPRQRVQRASAESAESAAQRIVDLVSAGHTNRQIATTLGISEKSVESHLTKVFARTGHRSRVEVTAALLGGRLTDTAEPTSATGVTPNPNSTPG